MNFFKKLFAKNTDQEVVTKRENHPHVYHIPDESERMNAGMEKARHTISYFKRSLTTPQSHQQYFSLKAKIVDGNMIEHIWLTDVTFDDSDNFYGHIGNEPLNVRNVKMGQKVGVALPNVSDWMIIENGQLIGGYTIRAIRDGKTGKDLAEFDKSIGLFIDEGVDYYEHDFTTPEGALLCLEDAYDEQNIEAAVGCKDFIEEARMMLKKMDRLSQFGDDEEILQSTGEALRLSFIKHFADHGFPTFKGVKRAFPKKQYVDDNLVRLTEVCIYPDHSKSSTDLYVVKAGDQWKVLGIAD